MKVRPVGISYKGMKEGVVYSLEAFDHPYYGELFKVCSLGRQLFMAPAAQVRAMIAGVSSGDLNGLVVVED